MTITKGYTAIPFHDKSADRLRKTFRFTGPTSYPTGGVTLSPADLGMSKIHVVLTTIVSDGTLVAIPWYNPATGKVMYFRAQTTAADTQNLVEVTATTNLSTYSGSAEVIGQ